MDTLLLIIGFLFIFGFPIVLYYNPTPIVMFPIVALLSLFLYIYGRTWRSDGFSSGSLEPVLPKETDKSDSTDCVQPYTNASIQNVDDYEYNLVFQNEGDTTMSKKVRDTLMSKYPMNWTTQPPSSELFQQGLASFKESFENPQNLNPTNKNPFKEIDGSTMNPPTKTDQDEHDILATYVPKKPQDLTTYDALDAKEIIDRVYSAKGLIPTVYNDPKEPNVFKIIGTRKKDEKIVYEDEIDTDSSASTSAVASSYENTIKIPNQAFAAPAGNSSDPFFNVDTSASGKWNYMQWTPGLERMFAPTDSLDEWY